ncbi:MAG: hypothetical protein KKE86_01440 [Planctomycetes bacterium]|nr:hypothetical protein [Planctomycetota bacterium]MBU4397977.1 hypothetical protein [Planctomycetota bacterium]MCG2682121.1 hypothetical protein [Planctomycetales bacterium]
MKFPRFRWQALKTALFCLFGWLSIHGFALAQAVKQAEKKSSTTGGGAYVMAYGLVILGATLGLLFVCRSSNRRDRARPEVYGEAKADEKEEE